MSVDTVTILDITWTLSIVWFATLGLVDFCGVLGFLERPFRSQDGLKRQRQIFVCSSLFLLTMSLEARAVWSYFKISANELDYKTTLSLAMEYFSRISECLQYSSCLVMCWQWALLCGRIVGWTDLSFTRVRRTLFSLNLIFWGGYVGTCEYAYETGGKFWVHFTRYDDVFVSCFFILSVVALVLFSRVITVAISRWSAINHATNTNNLATSLGTHAATRRAQKHSVRLQRATCAMAGGYLLRACSWCVSVVTDVQKGPYPWFYPLCFYQIPETIIAVAAMCIVGNLDVRLSALFQFLLVKFGCCIQGGPNLAPEDKKDAQKNQQQQQQQQQRKVNSLRATLSAPSLRVSYLESGSGDEEGGSFHEENHYVVGPAQSSQGRESAIELPVGSSRASANIVKSNDGTAV